MSRRVALMAAVALTLAACGGGAEPEPEAPGAQPTQTEDANGETEPMKAVTVEMTDEFTFEPADIEIGRAHV